MKRGVRIALSAVLLAVGAAFVGVGLKMGQATQVLQKAIRICLECIGIG